MSEPENIGSALEDVVKRLEQSTASIDPGPGGYWCVMGPDGHPDPQREDGPVGLFREDGSCVLFMARKAFEALYAEFGPPGEASRAREPAPPR